MYRWVVLLHTLPVAGRDVWLIVGIEEIGLDLPGEVLRVEPPVVQFVEDVLVEQATSGEHHDAVQDCPLRRRRGLWACAPCRASR
jgi:hypothetical protein